MEIVRQVVSIVFVFALLGAALWWLRRRGAGYARRRRSGGRLEAVERVSLTPQHALHLVRVGSQGLVVSSHPSGCSLLERLPWPQVEEWAQATAPQESHSGAGR